MSMDFVPPGNKSSRKTKTLWWFSIVIDIFYISKTFSTFLNLYVLIIFIKKMTGNTISPRYYVVKTPRKENYLGI